VLSVDTSVKAKPSPVRENNFEMLVSLVMNYSPWRHAPDAKAVSDAVAGYMARLRNVVIRKL
jgi:hypothetical protein